MAVVSQGNDILIHKSTHTYGKGFSPGRSYDIVVFLVKHVNTILVD